MKNIVSFCSLFFLFGLVISKPTSVLEIEFHTIKKGEVIFQSVQKVEPDTIHIKRGQLSFTADIEKPTLFFIYIVGYNEKRPMRLLLSAEKTIIEFPTLKKPSETKNIYEIYPNRPFFISDPNKNEVFYKFHDAWKIFYDQIQSLSTSDIMLEQRKKSYYSFLSYCDTLIRKNKSDYISAVIIDHLIDDNLLQLTAIQNFYDYLTQSVKDSFYGVKLGKFAGKAGDLQAGKTAPKYDFLDIHGNDISSNDLNGKLVLFHFWSSSCAPCLKEAPKLIELGKDLGSSLVIINVSLDRNRSSWLKGIDRAKLNTGMINVCDFKGNEGTLVQDYGITVIPTYFLINRLGVIVLKGTLAQVIKAIDDL